MKLCQTSDWMMLYVHRNRKIYQGRGKGTDSESPGPPQRPYRLLRDRREPLVVHLDLFCTSFELCQNSVSFMLLNVHSWLKCCFTSTETVGLLGTGAQDGHLDFHTAPEL